MINANSILILLIIAVHTSTLAACGSVFQKAEKDINSFEECAAAGFPIMESYPEQCRTPDGRVFVREVQDDGSKGIILGIVLLGPTCPVMQDPPDPDCADKPYQTELVLTTADQSKVIQEFRSDIYGRFQIEVSPGEYAIRSAAAVNVLPYCSNSETIWVGTNGTTEVTVFCDTGIR
jgi:hypothetical protein